MKETNEIKTSDNPEDNYEVPIEEYLKAGIHIGTKFKTKYMTNFIYKIRADGLYVLNLQKIDERLKMLSAFLAKFDPKDIIIASRRENSWKPVRMFGKLTGVNVFAGRYPPGLLTNAALKNFQTAKVVLVTDVWPDRNIIQDAIRVGIPVVALCDTNNKTNCVDFVVPCNNKGKKALALVFHTLARNYLRIRGDLGATETLEYPVEDFVQE